MPKQKKITTIKDLRAAKELSQAAFAKSIGVSAGSIGAYETGRMHPSDKVLEKINEVYGVLLTAAKKAEKKVSPKKAPLKKQAAPAAKKTVEVIIQSPLGAGITPDEILAKVGEVDRVYVRVDENKAYWVRGEETGSVDLW